MWNYLKLLTYISKCVVVVVVYPLQSVGFPKGTEIRGGD